MRTLRRIIELWRTRNHFKWTIQPEALEKNKWYHISVNVKRGENGEQYYDYFEIRKVRT